MSVLTGVGDFFRGAFGESEEEKRQRKLREAQAAQQRAAQAKAAAPQQVKNLNQLFQKPQAAPQAPQPKAAPVVVAPKPARVPVTAPRAGVAIPTANGVDLTKLKPVAPVTPAAKGSAQDIKNRAINTVGDSVARVATGVAQGITGLADLVTPGKGTSRLSKGLNQTAQEIDAEAKKNAYNKLYKVGNVVGETAGYLIPTKAAAKVAELVPKATRLTADAAESVARRIADPKAAGSIRNWLAEGVRKGMTLEELLADQAITSKYIGENASKGNDTSAKTVAADAALGAGGTIASGLIGKAAKAGGKDAIQTAEEAATAAVAAGTGTAARHATQEELDRLATQAKQAEDALDAKGLKNASEEELANVANNEMTLENKRQQAAEEIQNRRLAAEKAAHDADPLNTPTYQHQAALESIAKTADAKLNDYLARHPNLTPQQIEEARTLARRRAEQLMKELQDSRDASLKAVNDQGKAVDEAVSAKQGEVQAASEAQAAQAAPNPEQIVQATPAAADPERLANDATRDSTDKIAFGSDLPPAERTKLSLGQLFSPDRVIRENITQPLEGAVNRGVSALNTSDNKLARGVGRLFNGFSREAGVDAETQARRMQLRGGAEYGKLQRESIADLTKGRDPESTLQIYATLDPEMAGRLEVNIRPLTEDEKIIQTKLKTVIDNTTDENLRRGLITPEQAHNESYLKRAYTVYDGNESAGKFEAGFRKELMGQFKERKQVSDAMVQKAITDPAYLVGKKTAESNAMWAMQDYGNFLAKSGSVSDVEKGGFTQLPESPVFGDAAGKWIPRNLAEDFTGFQYNNAMLSAYNDLVSAYDRLGLRQAKKQLLTVFNPAVRLGNQVTNRGIFSQLSGINPLQFNKAMFDAKAMIKTNHPLYREAVQQGLTGVDVTQADFFAQRIAQSTGKEDMNSAKKALQWFQTSYSGADDQSRVAAYAVQRSRGYSPEEAAAMVQRGFQDYKSVGFFYDLASKTPLIGNAFVRFAGDSMRIAKNAAVDHPLRTLSTVALWNTFVNAMSVASGESELEGDSPQAKAFNLATGKSKSDAQKEREGRFGSPKIPFTDVALSVQTPWGEVNAARFAPWSALNDIGSGDASKFLPITASPISHDDKGFHLNPAGFNDPLLGQGVQLAIDKDFRGKSIQDPNNNATGDKYLNDPLSGDDKRNNILRFLFDNNAPLGRETDQTVAAARGESDIYGKDRSLPQALLRDMGFKVEQYGDEQRQKTSEMKAYQADLEDINNDLKDLSPSEQEAWKKLTGYYKMREQVDNSAFEPGTTRDKKAAVFDFSEDKYKEYAAHPDLYNLMVKKKQMALDRDGTPIAPEFDTRLSEGFRKQLIANKEVAPGDDAELDQRMYTAPEWDYYNKLKKEYKAAAADKYGDSDGKFTDELVKNQDAEFPDKPAAYQAYTAAYGLYSDGKAAKPEFTDAVKAAKEQYNQQTLDWTNEARRKRGLPAITEDVWNNPTFGFDTSPSGSGYGGGGGSSNPEDYTDNLGKLSSLSGDISPVAPVEAQAMPNLVALFQKLQAGSGGGHSKPTIGASARGQ